MYKIISNAFIYIYIYTRSNVMYTCKVVEVVENQKQKY